MRFFFILVEPAVPENIGASARAIKTMGFSDLRLINPHNHLDDKAKWLAHGSNDILEKAEVFNDFDTAISDLDFIIGTSAKPRSIKHDVYEIGGINKILENKCDVISKVGIVFGKEESGLSNEQINKCDILTFIQMKTTYPSLNLSQAVMLYTHNLSKFCQTASIPNKKEEDIPSYPFLKTKVENMLQETGFKKNTNIYNRILERLAITQQDDLNLINSICTKILKKIV